MKRQWVIVLILVITLVAVTPFSAFAANPHGAKKKAATSYSKDEPSMAETVKDVVDILISAKDRDIINRHIKTRAQGKHCPPGLAKKNNGCLPPGQAKKYAIGRHVPSNVTVGDLPRDLLDQLDGIAGYRFGEIDGDVVLISETTQKVVDAVEAISALAK